MKELFINSQQIDLYPGEPIALTKQVNKLNELKNRQANYTNQFKIPPTPNNLRITGFVNRVSSNSINAYTKLPCNYIENGSEIISNGTSIIESFEGDILITCYSGNYDFFEFIGDRSLRELDLSDADHIFNVANVIAGNTSDKYCYPLIQWGATDKDNNIVDIRYQMPVIKVPYLVDKIFSGAGYGKSGDVFEFDSYKQLGVPVVEDSLIKSEEVLDSFSFLAHMSANMSLSGSEGLFQLVSFLDTESGDAFDSSAGLFTGSKYIASVETIVNVSLSLHMNTPYTTMPGAARLVAEVILRKNLATIATYTRIESHGNPINPITNAVIEFENLKLKPGDYLEVYVRNIPNTTVFINDDSSPINYSYLSVDAINTVELGQNLAISNLIPDIKQKDLIKDIMYLYGLIPQVDEESKIVKLIQFKEIPQKIIPGIDIQDWSDKLFIHSNLKHPDNPKIRFRFEGYGQTNNIKWIQDDDRGEIGNGSIYIDDNTLEREVDLFTMTFAASLQETNFKGNNIGVNIKRFTINEETSEYEQTESAAPRLILIRDYEGELQYIQGDTINDTTVSNAKIAYFVDSSQGFHLGFEFLINEHYQDLIRVLDKTKIATVKINLTENEFKNVDFFKPVYIKYFGEYFYINIIPNYIGGRLASVELVRL